MLPFILSKHVNIFHKIIKKKIKKKKKKSKITKSYETKIKRRLVIDRPSKDGICDSLTMVRSLGLSCLIDWVTLVCCAIFAIG
jgi:hypothetical protein